MKSPGRMLCNTCYQDIGVTRFDEVAELWLYECPDCPGVDGPLTLEIPAEGTGSSAPHGRGGLMAELNVYDTVREAIGRLPARWLEFGVVEHLYAQLDPDSYQTLVERFGHVAIEPSSNTASWMLGRALWTLKRDNEVLVKGMAKGTGRWDYLSPCNAWALPGISGNASVVTWESYAEEQGFSPASHPAITWRDTPNAEPAAVPEPAE